MAEAGAGVETVERQLGRLEWLVLPLALTRLGNSWCWR